jgi:hypothetical protein
MSSDLESARSVDLRQRYAQTVFTFWTTLVYVRSVVLGGVMVIVLATGPKVRWFKPGRK